MEAQHQPIRRATAYEITQYLTQKGLKHKLNGDQIQVELCPHCLKTKERSTDSSNTWRLYLAKDGGAFKCHRCDWKGSFYEFKDFHGDVAFKAYGLREKPKSHPRPAPQRAEEIRRHTERPDSPVVAYLKSRGLNEGTIAAFEIGEERLKFRDKDSEQERWVEEACIAFPFVNQQGDLTFIKARSVQNKRNMRIEPKGAELIPFGLQLVPPEARELIIVEGEIDCMSIWQETGLPVVSLPNGANSLPVEALSRLQPFEHFVIAVDDDGPGMECRKRLAEKLGKKRCSYVEWRDGDANGPKDANEALRAGKSLRDMLLNRRQFDHEAIAEAQGFREQVRTRLFDKSIFFGTPFQDPRIKKATRLLEGLRMKELTIFSGPTGSGKTTIVSQMSLDWAEQGIPTLWGSFEISNDALIAKMIRCHSRKDIQKHPEEFDAAYDVLCDLPLKFLTFHGATKLEDIIDAIDYACHVHDIRHVIIDNLQFLIGVVQGNRKFDVQDEVIESLRRLKDEKNIHVTLLAHPKKYDQSRAMTEMDLFGSARTVQEADNIIVIDKQQRFSRLVVRKCREHGSTSEGTNEARAFWYKFDKASQSISECDIAHERAMDAASKAAKRKAEKADVPPANDAPHPGDDGRL